MPKRKTIIKMPDYKGTATKTEEMLVQKSRPLQSLSESDLPLSELKIIDAYLSRIDSHKPEARCVQFEKGELEKLFGVTKFNTDEISNHLNNLFKAVNIRDEHKPNNLTKIALFVKAECEQDENGQWQINLTCSEEAMEYIFNIDDIGYLRYRLKNISNLTSRYSYVLFLYLLDNRFRRSWKINLGELKSLMCCSSETYNQYKYFNDLILKKCYKEINLKTDLKFSYAPIRAGKKVTEIQFTIENYFEGIDSFKTENTTEVNSNNNQSESNSESEDDNRMTLDDSFFTDEIQSGNAEESYKSENNKFLAGACNYEFNNTQIQELIEIIEIIPRGYLPKGDFCDDISVSRYHYLAQKYAALNTYAEKQKIKNRFAYLKKIIKNDLEDINSKIPSDFV